MRGLDTSDNFTAWKNRLLHRIFAPADAPRYAIAVVIENEGRDPQVAAAVAREILRGAITE